MLVPVDLAGKEKVAANNKGCTEEECVALVDLPTLAAWIATVRLAPQAQLPFFQVQSWSFAFRSPWKHALATSAPIILTVAHQSALP